MTCKYGFMLKKLFETAVKNQIFNGTYGKLKIILKHSIVKINMFTIKKRFFL